MFKIVLRLFIICILVTLLVAPLIFYIANRINAANDLGNIKLITQGEFSLLDNYLKQFPSQEWQIILNKISPPEASPITVITINKLPLTRTQLTQLQNNQIVYVNNEIDPYFPVVAYKRIDHSIFAYRQLIEFNDIERAHRLFGLSQALILSDLNAMPPRQIPVFLQSLSVQFGYPVSIQEIDQLNLTNDQRQELKNKQWVVDYPNKKDDSLQFLYTPIPGSNQILIFGPIHLPLGFTYEPYMLLIAIFVLLELIIFFFAILFARSLDKLRLLSNDYSQGNFAGSTQVGKTSVLFPIFANLQNMGKRIKNLLNSHRELTNAVSHELRTPISRLRFSLELMKEAKSNENHLKHIETIEEDVAELEELVSEILTYAKLDRLEPAFELKPLNLSELIYLAIDKFNKALQKKQLIANLPDDASNYTVNGNDKYLLRVLQNLLQNANRYAKSIIKISLLKIVPDNYQLIIEDDGPGIPTEDRNRVFEPFAQLNNQINEASRGYGLGLAISKKIIDWHQWEISIEDSDLGGTKIIVKIPAESLKHILKR